MSEYCIAVKRAARNSPELPRDWQLQVAAVEGVAVKGASANSMMIEATDEAAAILKERFGAQLHIEAPIEMRFDI